jgi:hypothetical protein
MAEEGWRRHQFRRFDVLRQFWPEIARKFQLPFRGQNEPGESASRFRKTAQEV